tara:strand:- start:365 stop:565 length:201 start_codon:yes stop_codon:yes gene_type:complete
MKFQLELQENKLVSLCQQGDYVNNILKTEKLDKWEAKEYQAVADSLLEDIKETCTVIDNIKELLND